MTDNERMYWLTRCLRLELKIASLEQLQRASWPLPRKQHRRINTPDIAQMREWYAEGRSRREIARRLRMSEITVRKYTRGMQVVGEGET